MPRDFSVVAIVAAYNEADIIEPVVRDLIEQGVLVYLLDDGSTDGTVQAIEPYTGRGVIAIERLGGGAAGAPSETFAWERILRRKAQLATELDADWFIHHDADEFRESPWAGLTLSEAIRRVDALGYNAIDFASLDFWPTHDQIATGGDIRDVCTRYSEGAPYDRVQIRCWRKTSSIDLASSGGHEARFADRRVFPLRFISRHYPIRGQAHGERKVFSERKPRFLERELGRGWHVQYADIVEGAPFVRDPSTLTLYDADAVRVDLTVRHRGVEALEISLDATRAEAETRARAIEETRRELETKQTEVAELRAAFEQRGMELSEARALAASRSGELEVQQRAIAELHDALERREVEVGRVCGEAAARLQELEARRAEIAGFCNALGHRAAEISGLHDALAHRAAEIAGLRHALEHRAAEIDGLRDALEQRAAEVDRLTASVADGLRQLDALRRSLSWRWTSPARAAYRVLTWQ